MFTSCTQHRRKLSLELPSTEQVFVTPCPSLTHLEARNQWVGEQKHPTFFSLHLPAAPVSIDCCFSAPFILSIYDYTRKWYKVMAVTLMNYQKRIRNNNNINKY